MRTKTTLSERFWAKVDKSGECWTWTAARNKSGYGTISTGYRQSPMLAHRRSYEMAYGPIPDGMHVCHRCDNPPCVRPDHLFLGTDADNVMDMMRKGRYGPPRHLPTGDASWSRKHPDRLARGENHGCARVTAEQVIELRRLRFEEGKPIAELMAMFSLSKSQTFRIIRKQAWAHIPLGSQIART